VNSQLARLVVATENGDGERAARTMGLRVEGGRVKLIIHAVPGGLAEARAAVIAVGGQITYEVPGDSARGGALAADVPKDAIRALSTSRAIADIDRSRRSVADSGSQGAPLIHAPAWRATGLDGLSVKVGIIDEGFQDIDGVLGGELGQSVNPLCNRVSTQDDKDHGTATAEVVHAVAPGAALYVATADSIPLVREAGLCLANEGVSVVNMSRSSPIYEGPGDGTTPFLLSYTEIANNTSAAGVLWVNSAGNRAEQHWAGPWRDVDGDGVLDFAPTPAEPEQSITLAPGDEVAISLRWRDSANRNPWPGACDDYDLELLDDVGNVVESSDYMQDCRLDPDPIGAASVLRDGYPREHIDYTADPWGGGTYRIRVIRRLATGSEFFDLMATKNLRYAVAAGSLPAPADSASPGVLSVGAVFWDEPTVLLAESSAGPTTDGRVKPDLVGPSSVYTEVRPSFGGTSAAAPHVAGAAALVKQLNPALSPAQLKAYLVGRAQDTGRDRNMVGAGLVDLRLPPHGRVYGWGENLVGAWTQAPATQPLYAETPLPTTQFPAAVNVVFGTWGEGLVLLTDGTVRTFGLSTFGQAGDGTLAPATFPDWEAQLRSSMEAHQPVGLADVVAVAPGGSFHLALTADGTVWSWGLNQQGQLGRESEHECSVCTGRIVGGGDVCATGDCSGTARCSLLPAPITGLPPIRAIAAAYHQAVAVDVLGGVHAWGGHFGDGANAASPMPDVCVNAPQCPASSDPPYAYPCSLRPQVVSGITDAVSVATAEYYTLATLRDGAVRGWGTDYGGALGDCPPSGLADYLRYPTVAAVLPAGVQARSVAASPNGSAAALIDANGTPWGWGTTPAYAGLPPHGGCGYDGSFDPLRNLRLGPLTSIGLTSGARNIALAADGSVLQWGWYVVGPHGSSEWQAWSPPTLLASLGNSVTAAGTTFYASAAVVGGRAGVSPSRPDGEFGTQPTGASADLTVTLTSQGVEPVSVGQARIVGPHSDPSYGFAVVTDTCSGQSVPAGQSCTVTVRWQPHTAGVRNAYLALPNADAKAPQAIAISGEAVGPPNACGNGTCDAAFAETCHTCPQDCPSCCGDHVCAPGDGETCASCPADCGPCCGNGLCEAGETCSSCPQDCGPTWGDGVCECGETCKTSPDDCGACCPNGACDSGLGETCDTCPGDCGLCGGDTPETTVGGERSDQEGSISSPGEGDQSGPQRTSGSPVDGWTGALIVGPVEDLRLVGAFDDDIVVRRNYSSVRHGLRTSARMSVGESWALNLGARLAQPQAHDPAWVFVREDGRGCRFNADGSDQTGAGWRLEPIGEYREVTAPDGRRWQFDWDRRLVARSTRTGREVTIAYDEVERPVEVSNASGQSIHLFYDDARRLTEVRLGGTDRLLVSYAYQGALLTRVCYGEDCDGERWDYVHGGGTSGELVTEVWHGGVLEERHTYCAQSGDCAPAVPGDAVRLTETPTQRLVFGYGDEPCGGTRVEDLFSAPADPWRGACLTWDERGRLLSRDTPAGTTGLAARYVWGDGALPLAVGRPVGMVGGEVAWAWTARTYDDRRRLASETENAPGFDGPQPPPGVTRTTTYTYGDELNPLVPTRVERPSVLGAGATAGTRYVYDGHGNERERHDFGMTLTAAGAPIAYDYATYTWPHWLVGGKPRLVTGPVDALPGTPTSWQTVYAYNPAGGAAPAAGRVASITRYPGCPAGRCATQLVESFLVYDEFGRAQLVQDANGVQTETVRDQPGRVVTLRRDDAITTTYHDAAGRVQLVVLPEGNAIHHHYETFAGGFSRLKAVTRLPTAPAGIDNLPPAGSERVVYGHDAQGNVTSEASYRSPAAGDLESGVLERLVRREYSQGRVWRTLTAAGEPTVELTFDPASGAVVARTEHASATQSRTVSYGYSWGRLASAAGTEYGYDLDGRPVSVTDELGRTSSFVHDDLGRLVTANTPNAGMTRLAYTARGDVAARTDGAGRTVTSTHDAFGRVIDEVGGSGAGVQYSYDDPAGGAGAKGRLTHVAAAPVETWLAYDGQGRVAGEVRLVEGWTSATAYTRDRNGNLSRIDYPDDSRVTFTPSALDPDRPGQVDRVDPGGTPTALATAVTWRAGGGLAGLTYGNGAVLTRAQTLDGAPAAITVTDPASPGAFLWNASCGELDREGRPLAIGRSGPGLPDSTETYAYNELGRLVAATFSPPLDGGLTDEYRYRYTGPGGGGATLGVLTQRQRFLHGVLQSTDAYATGADGSLGDEGGVPVGQIGRDDRVTLAGSTSAAGTVAWCARYDEGGALVARALGGAGATPDVACEAPLPGPCFEHDDWGRVVVAGRTDDDGGCLPHWRYVYDHRGRRTLAYADSFGPFAGRYYLFHYDLEDRLILEAGVGGDEEWLDLNASYYLGGELLALGRTQPTQAMYFSHNDHLGTPHRLSQTDGTVKWAARFSPLGEVGAADLNPAVDCVEPLLENPHRVPGKYDDRRRGLGTFVWDGRRFYDPTMGTYIQPAGTAAPGGAAPHAGPPVPIPPAYAYRGNDPISPGP
jgi:YD repeat-containing protein